MSRPPLRLAALAAAALLLAAGTACRTWLAQEDAPAAATEPVKSALVGDEKQAKAEAILDDLLAGLGGKDRARYLAHLTKEQQERATPANFAKMAADIEADLGTYRSRQFLGHLDQQVLDIYIWKVRFDKVDEDALIRLVLGEVDGRLQVFGFHISPY